ncbi:MAG: tRNA (N(6)-L-threonylcarbamoyladenosine(37)-C(2))-methylthiotransferase MtaB [Clostridia bacterium]|nr:tRNA (N(6)-L-threonylcarbamoyladenosine(37)-C(2))-methylthiotransferase MtaB [Clostridia bacterium]MDD4686193.1 tRNA (N(6)-L-threonylcarbamoyladenosine(37)-C(2))-methylthiotransferase MtaB [Clostridia bacterium]
MKYVIITLGCKVNQYESDALVEMLQSSGNQVSQKLEFADVYILNSCAVTNEAERKSRQMIAKFNRLNPKAKIFVCGCASQKDNEQFKSLNNVKFIMGNANKLKILEKINKKGKLIEKLPDFYENISITNSSNQRAFVKIQDGCNKFCSYCIIPYLRGKSRSRDIVSILNEVSRLAENGIKEVVLTGIDISDYQIDNKPAIIELLKQLDNFNVRVRMSSMEVGLITDEFLKNLKKIKLFCPHFHLSMQSGSTGVLKRMNRRYTSQDFINAVKKIRRYFNNCAITTDIIVGFPGETDKEFNETIETVKKIKFAYMHIFPYSRRSGTAVDKLLSLKVNKDYFLVDSKVKKSRVNELQNLNQEFSINFNRNQIRKIHEVIVEELHDDFYTGHSRNYTKVYIKNNNAQLKNKVVKVKVVSVYKDGVIGEIISEVR